MVRRAHAGRSVAELAGRGLGGLDDVGDRVGGVGRMRHQQERAPGGEAHGREVLLRIETQLALVEAAVHDERIHRYQEGVAVGRGARYFFGADIAAGARQVFDHDGLAERLGQAGRQLAGDQVDTRARRERHDQRDGALRP
ncbi:hypothetical protein D9M68_873510 [compost metagenome]